MGAPIRRGSGESPPVASRPTRRRAPATTRSVRVVLKSAAMAVFLLLLFLPVLFGSR